MKNTVCKMAMVAFSACLLTAGVGFAEDGLTVGEPQPLGLSLVPATEFPKMGEDILGFRLGVVSRHHNVSMMDLNLLAAFTDGVENGLQLSGFYNSIHHSQGLLQMACLANNCEQNFAGAQLSVLFNNCKGSEYGASLAVMNMAGELNGLQIGLVNRSKKMEGLQIGLVNYADESEGIQIGLVNVIIDGKYPVFPLFNFGIWK